MKPCRSNQGSQAMTLFEVLVVIAALVVLAAMLLPALSQPRRRSRINCINDIHQIGLAYKSWASDNNDKYPMEVSTANGGAMELAMRGIAYANFQVMSNELSTPKVLICPQDTNRITAKDFAADFNNTKISYFVGLDATCTGNPQRVLSGDNNLEIHGIPIKIGLLQLSTNNAIGWTGERHKLNGNIGLVDGSAAQVSAYNLQTALHKTGVATNRFAIP